LYEEDDREIPFFHGGVFFSSHILVEMDQKNGSSCKSRDTLISHVTVRLPSTVPEMGQVTLCASFCPKGYQSVKMVGLRNHVFTKT
jgi:hypothetical protein